MAKQLTAFIRTLQEAEPYDQDEPGEALFHTMVNQDEIPGLSVGHVELKGPIHKTPASHGDWHQAYFVYHGSGVIHLADRTQAIEAPTMISIPKNTHHAVEVPAGGELRYIYINQWR